MSPSDADNRLYRSLGLFPSEHENRYGPETKAELLEILFRSLAGDDPDLLSYFFPPLCDPTKLKWSLRAAQGAVEGAEYSEAARGTACGHIFKAGEASYRCKTCTNDDTCVLCAKCFEASDHEGHIVYVSISPGNSGCCDCGDDEAWIRPPHCNIHSPLPDGVSESKDSAKAKATTPDLPQPVIDGIRRTISIAFDYLCDVFSCSPEQLRLPKTLESVQKDELQSRLSSKWFPGVLEWRHSYEACNEFALILWNDEKHTVEDVKEQVARACKISKKVSHDKALEIDDIGRSVILYSYDLKDLLRMASIIEEIKLTVTVRSARDTFREQMCEYIIEWICDIAGCSVGDDAHILRNTICEELLKPWRAGSKAHHVYIGKDGIDDHASEDNLEEELRGGYPSRARLVRMAQQLTRTGQGQVIQIGGGAQIILGDTQGILDEDEDEDDEDRMDVDTADDRAGDDIDTSDGPEDSGTVGPADSLVYPSRRGSALPSMTPNTIQRTRTSSVPVPFDVPTTPRPITIEDSGKPDSPSYWLEKPAGYLRNRDVPIAEDLWQRVRLDYLILYDLRMWKNCRIDVRDVFISTVVTLPHFKRLMGLRFAGLYTLLAQLYLIADREPDHSIINLSLQMLTTPSITAEVVDRGNFLSNLMAILYTFITTRQVGYPSDVDPKAILSLEQGTVTNRRIYHFFMDMKYMLSSTLVQGLIRDHPQYLLQFLDLVKLHQGIVPNVRALGEHVEFEPETWISASIITREMNRLCRQFAESFGWRPGDDKEPIRRAIRETAKVVIINSTGAEQGRFVQCEIAGPVRFDVFPLSEFHRQYDSDNPVGFRVVQYEIGKEPMSFHHALHYTFSWLVDRAKCMDNEEFRGWIKFTVADLLAEPSPEGADIPDLSPHDYLLAMFDYPLRVCAWLAQMKANMWVRNGVTLRHQMQTYRGHTQRDLAYLRDIFLLQLALVVCDPQIFLATMVDRFDLRNWALGDYSKIKPDRDELQMLEMAEEFVHLLIVLLLERTFLLPIADPKESHLLGMRRDIVHILAFKPMSHSDITQRMSEKVQDSDELAELLDQMTRYKAPEGVSDVGTFELKKEFIAEIDPYIPQYSRNQREEAENIYKRHMADTTGMSVEEIVYEPKPTSLQSGIFKDLAQFTKTPMFIQVVFSFLELSLVYEGVTTIPAAKIEVFLQFVLTLILIAVNEDRDGNGFVVPALYAYREKSHSRPESTIIWALQSILSSKRFEACAPKIRLILKRMKEKKPEEYADCVTSLGLASPLLDPSEPETKVGENDKELKKKQALERQAKIMAQFKQQQNSFVQNQAFDWGDDDFSDLEDEFATAEEEEPEKVRKFPTGTCIMCQEETDNERLFGTFSFISESAILRQTPTLDMDWIEEVRDTPASLDSSAESIRPFGVAGKNRRTVEKFDAEGNVTSTERQDLAKGFPSNHIRRGPVATGCGHLMHWTCFEDYFQATHRRHLSQVSRLHPERLDLGEFECPLCKALGNAFLPIIWKPQKVSQVEQGSVDLNSWISNELPQYLSRYAREEEESLTKKLETVSETLHEDNMFLNYGSQEFAGRVSSLLTDYSTYRGSVTHPVAVPDPATGQLSQSMHVLAPAAPGAALETLRTIPVYPLIELNRSYIRLNTTFKLNNIPSRHTPHSLRQTESLTSTDALMRVVGFSISAAEIAQRGVESRSGTTLLEKVPEQTLMHLRIVSETVKSYISIGCIRSDASPITSREYTQTVFRQLQLLFPDRPELGNDAVAIRSNDTLLGQDAFLFLTECAFGIIPALNVDLRVVMRLCYLAEMVRVILAFMDRKVLAKYHEEFSDSNRWSKQPVGPEEARSFLKFFKLVSKALFPTGPVPSDSDLAAVEGMTPFIHTMVTTYMLPFLRKCMILMNVRFATEFSSIDASLDEPEMARLEKALKLPSMHEIIFEVIGSSDSPAHSDEPLYGIICSWVRHYHEEWLGEDMLEGPAPYPKPSPVSLGHPAIFELVGLPRIYDSLTVEAFKRHCPTTGRYMTDPVVCLLCGEIFCSQAVCCLSERTPGSRERRGGCNQHQVKCGGTTGIYINIRKGMVILLSTQPEHQGMSMGSWANAPYLDKHGEADPTLRRHHQLFLNQKRYDVLFRQLWLNHGIASAIARKLDSEYSYGGWETT